MVEKPILDLMFFCDSVEWAIRAKEGGIRSIVLDMEDRQKMSRQRGYHLECAPVNYETVAKIRKSFSGDIFLRINPVDINTELAVQKSVQLGMDWIILPMFKSLDEIKNFYQLTPYNVKKCLLFETKEAIENCELISFHFSPEMVYIGLNDLMISYKKDFCYEFILTGEIERVKKAFPDSQFGFGGITVLDSGFPLKTNEILTEIARLKADAVIVRRAFKRDVEGKSIKEEHKLIQDYYRRLLKRTEKEEKEDYRHLIRKVQEFSLNN